MKKNVAIVGATGNVGRKVIEMILNKNLVSADHIHAFASPNSKGKILDIAANQFTVKSLEDAQLKDFDLCIFNTENDISKEYVPKALAQGCFVIDSSSEYRLDKDTPLIIPPVNIDKVNQNNKLYSHANCLASPIATVIAPLHKYRKILKMNAVTYQATSGAGKRSLDECVNETKAKVNNTSFKREQFNRQIAFNVIPQVGSICDDGMTSEEYKIINEVQKVVDNDIAILATAVRVPVLVGHCIALSLEFSDNIKAEEVKEVLKSAKSVKVYDDYLTPVEVVDTDEVHVGRIRSDGISPCGIQMWLCSDNLRRGASTDCIEIAEKLLQSIS